MNNIENKSPRVEGDNNLTKEKVEVVAEKERTQTNKEEAIFDELRREQETTLLGRYAEKIEFSDELKETADRHLLQEADESTEGFVNAWAKEKKEEIKEAMGVDVSGLDMAAKMELCREQGGFEELRKEEKYREWNRDINNIHTLLYDLKKDNIPIDSQLLILNRLDHRVDKVKKELAHIQKQGNEIETRAKEIELAELLQVTQEMSQKIGKGDLEKIAEQKGTDTLIRSLGEKEGYVNDRLSNEKKAYLGDNLEDELKRVGEEGGYLQLLGYSMETKGFLRKRTIIEDEVGNVICSFERPAKAVRFLKREGERKIEEDLGERFKAEIGKEWEDSRTAEIKKVIHREVRKLARSPEKANEGIEFVYREARQRLIQEFKEKELKKEVKVETEGGVSIGGEIYQKGAGESVERVMSDLLKKKGPFEGLRGNWKEDRVVIERFFDSMDIPTEHLGVVEEDMRERGMIYEEREGLGSVNFLLELIFQSMRTTAEGAGEGDKR